MGSVPDVRDGHSLSLRETRLAGASLALAGIVGAWATILSVPIADPSGRVPLALLLGGGSLFATVQGLRLVVARRGTRVRLPRPLLYGAGLVLGAGGLAFGLLLSVVPFFPDVPLDTWASDASSTCFRLAKRPNE